MKRSAVPSFKISTVYSLWGAQFLKHRKCQVRVLMITDKHYEKNDHMLLMTACILENLITN